MKEQKKFIFIGDSITNSDKEHDSDQIGNGYVRLLRDQLIIKNPSDLPQVINKGNNGDRIIDLASRWQEDVIDIKPDYISVSIGINDVWRQLDQPEMEQVYPEQFKQIYKELILQVKAETDANIILMEPTIIKEVVDSDGNHKLKDYVRIVNELASDLDAVLVPTHQVFINFIASATTIPLTTDGVHMSSVGNMLMAQTWMKVFEKENI